MTEKITKFLLFSVLAVTPFLKISSLYFPFISGKVYFFRLLVMLAFFSWLYLLLKEKKYRPDFKNILIIAFVLFFLAQVLASFFGVDSLFSFFSSIERGDGVIQFGFWVLYFLILISLLKKENDWKLLMSLFVVVAILVSLYAWVNFKSQSRLEGIFGNPSYLAAFLLFAIGFSAVMIEQKFFKDRRFDYLLLAIIGFFIATLIFTQTRGAYAGLAAGIVLFCLLSVLFLRKQNKKLAISCGIFLLVAFVSLTALFLARETEFVKSKPLLTRVTEITRIWEVGAVRERILTWQIALKAFKEKPIFGWGPENFGSAFNKYYDYRIGLTEPWFDRTHSQPLEILAVGGIIVFSFYLFWLFSALYLIFKIYKARKVLSFILFSIFAAYFIQGLFLFDTLPIYLGLFPFLGFLVFEYNLIYGLKDEQVSEKNKNHFREKTRRYLLIPAAFVVFFIIFTTCFIPYKANALIYKFYAFSENDLYRQSELFLKECFAINSPYTFWEVRKRAGWQFLGILEYRLDNVKNSDEIEAIKDIYGFMTSELERFVEHRPYEPQVYYLLARIYRLGHEKLGYDDVGKAEKILTKGFNYSDRRVEYFDELAQALVLQGRFKEAETTVKDYVEKMNFTGYFPFVTLGHFYFIAEKYDLAMEEYEKARTAGYNFYEIPYAYSRYLVTAEQLKDYQKVVDMASKFLERWGPDADTFFNIAVGYLNLEEKEKAKEFFFKAVEMNKDYEGYRLFFEN